MCQCHVGTRKSIFFFDRPWYLQIVKIKNPVPLIYTIALIAVSAFFFLHREGTSDLFWQIKTGELIWQTRAIPNLDIFSYTAFGSPWINHEWLSEVVFYLTDRIFGFAGLSCLSFAIGFSIAFCLFLAFLKLSRSVSIGLMLVFAVFFIGAPRFQQLRPELFGILFFSMVLALLATAESPKKLWCIIPIQILWVNMHASAILGPLLILIYGIVMFLAASHRGMKPPIRMRLFIAILFVSLLAMLVNPYTYEAYTFPFEHLSHKYALSVTTDWAASSWFWPRSDIAVWGLAIAAIESIFVALKNRERISYPLLAVAAVFLPAGFAMTRFVPLSIIAIAFFIASAIKVEEARPNVRRAIALVLCLGIPIISSVGGPFYGFLWGNGKVELVYGRPVGVGFDKEEFPVEAVDFLESASLGGNVFNDMAYGGYLIYRRWPRERVFFDTRTPVYSERFYAEYVWALQNKRAFEEIAKQYKIKYVLFDARQMEKTGELSFLLNNPRWKIVFASDNATVFVRSNP